MGCARAHRAGRSALAHPVAARGPAAPVQVAVELYVEVEAARGALLPVHDAPDPVATAALAGHGEHALVASHDPLVLPGEDAAQVREAGIDVHRPEPGDAAA